METLTLARIAHACASNGISTVSNGRPMLDRECLLLVDGRALDRQCLAKALSSRNLGLSIVAVASADEWRLEREIHPPVAAVLLNLGGQKLTDGDTADELVRLVSELKPAPVIIVTDNEDLGQLLKALECGARGYIPTSVGVEICAEAIGLAKSGGIFVPASSILAVRHLITDHGRPQVKPESSLFTSRQAEVAEALRRGKANKAIAHELKLRESTVKVHIRNIMKKLKAKNRTEVAFKINDLWTDEPSTTR